MADNQEVTTMSQADFARYVKVKPQAITKAINADPQRLIRHGKGRAGYIDLECPLTIAYMKSDSVNRHRPNRNKPPGKPPIKSSQKKVTEQAPPSPESIASVKAFNDKQEIERLKKLQETKKIEIHNAKERGKLIDREIVRAFVHGMHEIDNGQWKTLGLKVSTDIAAELGIEDEEKIRVICDLVDKAAYTILKQVQRAENKFLKKLGAEKLPAKMNQNAA